MSFEQFCNKYWLAFTIVLIYISLPLVLGIFFGVKLETILSFFTILTGVFAIIALGFTAKGLNQNIEQEKINRSWDCLKLYMNPSCRKVISSVGVFLNLERITPQEKSDLLVPGIEELEDKVKMVEVSTDFTDLLLRVMRCLNLKNQEIDKIEKNEKGQQFIKGCALFYFFEIRSRVNFIQNLFETIGTLYNKNQLDKKIIKGFFKTISLKTYKQLEDVIEQRRNSLKQKQPTLFKQWEDMNKELQE